MAARYSQETWPRLSPPHQGLRGARRTATLRKWRVRVFHPFVTSHPQQPKLPVWHFCIALCLRFALFPLFFRPVLVYPDISHDSPSCLVSRCVSVCRNLITHRRKSAPKYPGSWISIITLSKMEEVLIWLHILWYINYIRGSCGHFSCCTCFPLGLFVFEILSYDLLFCILLHNWMMNEPLGQCSAVWLGNLTAPAAWL